MTNGHSSGHCSRDDLPRGDGGFECAPAAVDLQITGKRRRLFWRRRCALLVAGFSLVILVGNKLMTVHGSLDSFSKMMRSCVFGPSTNNQVIITIVRI